MNYPATNLTNCDKEPIHVLGKVQAHGFLVAFDPPTSMVLFTSNNLQSHVGVSPQRILNRPIQQLFLLLDNQGDGTSLLNNILDAKQHTLEDVNPTPILIKNRLYDMISHISDAIIVLEFEMLSADWEAHLHNLIGSSLSKIINAGSLDETIAEAAMQVHKLIGYDRVMVYRFWEDGHGEVIAEVRDEALEPLLGLHYPASDIPKQARELYKLNLTRMIADVDSIPAEILWADTLLGPLDLTYSTLRAVSEVHIQYLKNMGVKASFSISILHDGELWGLIACHHYQPRVIGYKAREHTKLIGQVLSSSFQYKAEQEQKEDSLAYMEAASKIVMDMHRKWDFYNSVSAGKDILLKVTSAGGAAVIFDGKIYKEGITPSDEQIKALVVWLSDIEMPNIYYTHCLSKQYLPAQAYIKQASGMLSCTISKELGDFVLFFKPEVLSSVTWAGDPQKMIEKDSLGNFVISPRHSFKAWSEEVTATAQKWSRAEINTVVKFREDVVHLVNMKSLEVRKLNEQLKATYAELDSFCSTVSHDLRTPLALVKTYAELLLERYPDGDPELKLYLNRILKSEQKMETMITELLAYSKQDIEVFTKEKVEVTPMLLEIKMETMASFKELYVEWIFKNTPPILGHKILVNQVFSNVLGNAVKYSSRSINPVIVIDAIENEHEVVYSVQDNGIGIEKGESEAVFGIFKRMENSKGFEGSGVGLSIVQRIMTKHGGKVWYDSGTNGTSFLLAFPKN